MQDNQSRRQFMQTALATATALSLADQILAETQTTNGQGIPRDPWEIRASESPSSAWEAGTSAP